MKQNLENIYCCHICVNLVWLSKEIWGFNAYKSRVFTNVIPKYLDILAGKIASLRDQDRHCFVVSFLPKISRIVYYLGKYHGWGII